MLGLVWYAARELVAVVAEAVDRRGDRVFEGGHFNSPGVWNRPVRQRSTIPSGSDTLRRRVLGFARGHRRPARRRAYAAWSLGRVRPARDPRVHVPALGAGVAYRVRR